MRKIINPSDLILVAFMPNPRDMEIARVLGWYKIPLKSAPKVVSVDWLAFYQPASFGKEHKWRIEKIAPVQGHEMLPRHLIIKDEPDHKRAEEEYFKIQLGPMQELPQPIMAGKWKRILFLYTTGDRLLTSETIDQLPVKNEERTVLWRALRERELEYQTYKSEDLPEFPIPDDVMAYFGFMMNVNPFGDGYLDEEKDDN